MPFFPAEQDWTLALMARPSRILLKEQFPATYTVNSLLALGSRKTQCRKGPDAQGKHTQTGANNIPISDKNRYGTRKPGELAEDREGIPEHWSFPLTTTIPLVGLVSYFLSGHRRHSPCLSLPPSSLLVSGPKATTLRTGLDLASPTRGVCRLATLGPQNPRLCFLAPRQRPLGLLLGTTVDTSTPLSSAAALVAWDRPAGHSQFFKRYSPPAY